MDNEKIAVTNKETGEVVCEGRSPAEAWFNFIWAIACSGAPVDEIKEGMEQIKNKEILYVLDSIVAVLEGRMDYEPFAEGTEGMEELFKALYKSSGIS